MKTMILSDMLTLRRSLLQMLALCAVMEVLLCAAMQVPVAGAAAIIAMLIFITLFSLCAYDEQRSWQEFRLTLPLSRTQVVAGRYGTVLLVAFIAYGMAVALEACIVAVASTLPASWGLEGLSWAANPLPSVFVHPLAVLLIMIGAVALSLPLTLRFGLTRATRFIPVVIVLIISFSLIILDNDALGLEEALEAPLTALGEGGMLGLGALLAAVLYGASALVSVRLYRTRDF